jgi:hypothetical protein
MMFFNSNDFKKQSCAMKDREIAYLKEIHKQKNHSTD